MPGKEGGGGVYIAQSLSERLSGRENCNDVHDSPSVQLSMTETGLERWLSLPSKNPKSRRRCQKDPGRQRE